MNLNAALDVAIGLIVMYLVLSLFCTTINEIIAWVLHLRAKNLRSALAQLIDDPRLKALFYDHGLIDGAKVASKGGSQAPAPAAQLPQKAKNSDAATQPTATGDVVQPAPTASLSTEDNAPPANLHPSYLSSSTVAAALTGSLLAYIRDDKAPLPVDADMDTLKAAIGNLQINSNIRDALSACVADAGKEIDKFRDNVARWFDNSMDRLSGAYKRNLQLISLGVGLIIAVALNADTLNVANRLWSDQALSQVISQTASNMTLAKEPLSQDTIRSQQPQCASKNGDNDLSNDISTLCALNADLRPLPIGWNPLPTNFGWAILGWLITAIALTQGAPFWFDLLQKIMNFRATGDKPKRADDKK
jgi:hypothetical protein